MRLKFAMILLSFFDDLGSNSLNWEKSRKIAQYIRRLLAKLLFENLEARPVKIRVVQIKKNLLSVNMWTIGLHLEGRTIKIIV